MKVLMANRYFYPYLGGVEFHILNLSKQLLNQGCEVTVLCLKTEPDMSEEEEYDGIRILRVSKLSQIWRHVSSDYDVCHAHMPRNWFAFTAMWAAKLKGVPTVFTPHCFYPGGSLTKKFFKWLCDRIFMPPVFMVTDCMVNLTPADQKDAHGKGGGLTKSVIIPNSIDTDSLSQIKLMDIRDKYDLRRPFFLHVGRFDPVKHIDFIVSQHVTFADKYDLVLIGQDDGELERIRHQVEQLKLHDVVKIIERASFAEVCSAYSEAALTVLASEYEGLPTALLEAIYFGSPVLASDVGGVPFLLDHAPFGKTFGFGNAKDYSNKAKQVLTASSSQDFKKLVEHKYSWQKNAIQIYELYSEYQRKDLKIKDKHQPARSMDL